MFVKPAPDRMIRWPRTFAPLRAEGEHVPDHDPYWLRALADADIVETDAPAVATEPPVIDAAAGAGPAEPVTEAVAAAGEPAPAITHASAEVPA